jgi:ankyrin repeat protein
LTEPQVALIRAIELNEANRVAQILAKSVNVNFRSNDGWTPLELAVVEGNLRFVRALLQAGAKRRLAIVGCPRDTDALGLVPLKAPASGEIRKALLTGSDPGTPGR